MLGVSFIQPTLRPPTRSPRELLLRKRLPRPRRGPQTGLRPSPEHPRPKRPPASRSWLLRDTRRGPDRILLHMHTHIRTLKPTARTWPSSPFLFRIKPQPYVPASSGHPISVLQNGLRPVLTRPSFPLPLTPGPDHPTAAPALPTRLWPPCLVTTGLPFEEPLPAARNRNRHIAGGTQ